ncbi:MAG TPA: hypothetical protein VKT51_08865 [Candidatus Eremiobacteraceae bacterium]|nr:hypothetical protein [Candidatus Eremiobacteraceae bacterium]
MRRVISLAAFAFVAALALSYSPSNSVANSSSSVALAASIQADIPMFATEDGAQKHCPADTVVWLNTNSGIYHLKGERWYGRTKHGAYVCKKEADAAGYRETENGQ